MRARWLAGALAPRLAAAAVRVLGATLRVTVVGADGLARRWASGDPLIYAVWHGRILMVPWLHARLATTHGARPVTVLVSRSRDGEILARYVRRFGLESVRGSSSRGGGEAMRALVARLRRGRDVAVVPDGPRGPRCQLQPGIVALAALTGAPIVPLGVAARPSRRLASWDEFMIPMPLARCAAVFGDPVSVARDADRARAAKEVERGLADVTAAADRLVGA
jgi:lysophospholipid acyltransferase (LPLAT)-like uncharacterized protein